MLRLVLLLIYLIASSTSPHDQQTGGIDPLGLGAPPPQSDAGSGADPLG